MEKQKGAIFAHTKTVTARTNTRHAGEIRRLVVVVVLFLNGRWNAASPLTADSRDMKEIVKSGTLSNWFRVQKMERCSVDFHFSSKPAFVLQKKACAFVVYYYGNHE